MPQGGAVMLRVADLEAATRFYAEALGFARGRFAAERGVELHGPGLTLLLAKRAEGQPKPDANPFAWVALVLWVDDVARSRSELEAKGVAFEGDVVDSPFGRVAFFSDPDGYTLGLVERSRAG